MNGFSNNVRKESARPERSGACSSEVVFRSADWPRSPLVPTIRRQGTGGKKPAAGNVAPQFEADILPLFQAKCLRCHGDKTRKAELDLRTPAGVFKGGESGAAVLPGKPEKSLLYEKVLDGTMPPGKKNRLSEAEVATIRRWIEAVPAAPVNAEKAAETAAALTQHDVLPILLRSCTTCHGLHRKEGGLDLRTRAAMLRGGKSGAGRHPR